MEQLKPAVADESRRRRGEQPRAVRLREEGPQRFGGPGSFRRASIEPGAKKGESHGREDDAACADACPAHADHPRQAVAPQPRLIEVVVKARLQRHPDLRTP